MEELICSVCRDEYEAVRAVPVVMPLCGHTFCRPCVVLVCHAGRFECPTCRKGHSSYDPENLPTNYAVLNLAEDKKNKFRHGSCRQHSNPLDFWCGTCREALCGLCIFHGHIKDGHDVHQAKNLVPEMQKDALTKGNMFLESLKMEQSEQVKKGLIQVLLATKFAKNIGELQTIMNGLEQQSGINEILHNASVLDSMVTRLTKKEPADQAAGIEALLDSPREPDSRPGLESAFQEEWMSTPTDACRVSFVGSNNRHSRVRWENDDLLVYCLSFEAQTCSINIQISQLQLLLPHDNPEVFMSLGIGANRSVPTTPLGRIRILLNGRSRNAQQFLALCLGTPAPGIAYRGSRFSNVDEKGENGEQLRMSTDSRCNRAYVEDLEDVGFDECLAGLVCRVGPAGFQICTRDDPGSYFPRALGHVIEGMDVVMEATQHEPITEVMVTEVGVIVPT